MANYADYVQQSIDDEITEAAEEAERRASEYRIPERFKGKTAEEIARSYEELAELNSRQANELGELRRSVAALTETVARTSVRPNQEEKPAPKPVTVDEIYENADAALRRVVKEESADRIEKLERELEAARRQAEVAAARARFEAKHPDYKDILSDPAFVEWIKASPFRVRAAQAADAGDFDAADDLFSTYAELKAAQAKKDGKAKRRDEVRRASLETSGGDSPAPVEKFSRTKLQEYRIAANRGDLAAERWLQANAQAIRDAYAEDRLMT